MHKITYPCANHKKYLILYINGRRCSWYNDYNRNKKDRSTSVQNFDKYLYFSNNANTFEKGMNATIHPPAMGK